MAQVPLEGENVYETERSSFLEQSARQHRKRLQVALLTERPRRLTLLLQNLTWKSAGQREMPSPVGRKSEQGLRLIERLGAPVGQERFQFIERDADVQLVLRPIGSGSAETGVHDVGVFALDAANVPREGDRRRHDGGEERQKLGRPGAAVVDHHRTRRAQPGTVAAFVPEPQILGCDEFVADRFEVDGTEPGLEAGIEDLFRRGREEENADFVGEYQESVALRERLDTLVNVAHYVDRIVVARGYAQPALDARSRVNAELVPGHGDCLDRTDPHARHARRAFLVNREPETHVPPGPLGDSVGATLKSRYPLLQQWVGGLQETYP